MKLSPQPPRGHAELFYSPTQPVQLSDAEVQVSLVVTITGYDHTQLDRAQAAKTGDKWKPIEVEFKFSLYNPLQLELSRLSVYLHPSNSIYLRTIAGSGHYAFSLNAT